MIVRVLSASYIGIDPYLVEVEVDVSSNLPSFSIVGLGDTAIDESKYRIRTALRNCGYGVLPRRVVVNLSPAGIRKEGVQFDLPIAVGLILAQGFLPDRNHILDEYLIMGELSLDGRIKAVKGTINAMILAREMNFKGILLPAENQREARIIKGVEIVPIRTLNDVERFFKYGEKEEMPPAEEIPPPVSEVDFADVKGQVQGKRGLEIAAAGGHNVLMIGSPGSGKSMLARRIISIMPPMTEKEIIECTKIHSVAGTLSGSRPVVNTRPFRAPHHTSSPVSIIGGGTKIMPGEISLASGGGVLFLDEFPEFSRQLLESLRQPLEDGVVSITRAMYRVEFPCRFLLIAAANPCKCGFLFEGERCTCSTHEVSQYQKKLSGPILDRIDLHIEMRRLTEEELTQAPTGESSREIQKRVEKARAIQEQRNGEGLLNAYLGQKEMKKYCVIAEDDLGYFKSAIRMLEISARGYDKILKVSRTIADLDGSVRIRKEHLLEAISFRRK
ncbi:MAG: YifB family Mg chelatase-like AAA ATPase [Fusobacteriaceae bacterium]|jgi:magnesium chelatase family protein|nr:YifB family Mg chelatase-like AAA ATPase [Fusobacteriaceae bacterium]